MGKLSSETFFSCPRSHRTQPGGSHSRAGCWARPSLLWWQAFHRGFTQQGPVLGAEDTDSWEGNRHMEPRSQPQMCVLHIWKTPTFRGLGYLALWRGRVGLFQFVVFLWPQEKKLWFSALWREWGGRVEKVNPPSLELDRFGLVSQPATHQL